MRFCLAVFLSFVITLQLGQAKSFNSSDGLFLEGYDPVSYLSQKKAVKGKKEISHSYQGQKVLFSSQENKKRFLKDAEKYIPAYHGWCAYAMYKSGELVEVDPTSFKIIDGKIYLFYQSFLFDTLASWNKGNDQKQVGLADKNWQKQQ